VDAPEPSDDNPGQDLFPNRLPSGVAMGIGLLLILLFGAALVAAIVVPIPDTIRCPFVLISEGGTDPVRAPVEGVLEEVRAQETREVAAGERLFTIQLKEFRSRERQSWTTELGTLEQEQASIRSRQALLEESYRNQRDIQQTKIAQSDKELAFREKYLATCRDFLQRMEALEQKGLTSRVDTLSQRLEAARAERDVDITRQAREMATLELKRLQNEHDTQVAKDRAELDRLAVRIEGLNRERTNYGEDRIQVLAPFAGTIVSVERKNAGDVVSSGQELCRIARPNATLAAELTLAQEGVPRVRPGLRTQLFFEAFPYQRFGTGMAVLRWVSPAAVKGADGDRFVARAALDQTTMKIGGERRPLSAGMKGEARVMVGQRNAIEYVFEPIRQLRESFGNGKQ
jgi:multidrug efflux pump subunit AcrA (membrane-fusion protein)